MAKHVCPWWLGYLLASPLRRWLQDPEKILSPYIAEGMTVLDIGPGMGFFTIPAARMIGETGKVIAVDIQERMLSSLRKRAEKAGVAGRIITKVCGPYSLGISEQVDLCLAFNVVHEVPDARAVLLEIRGLLKPTGKLFLVEPHGHVSEKEFQATMALASATGLKLIGEPKIRRSRSAIFALD